MYLTLIRRFRPPLEKGLWQDPILGYFETHGKMEFKPGEEYGLNDDEKKAVMERYKIKEILKRRYIEQEYNPLRYKYVEGIIIDPSMFRWYALEMEHLERFRITPKTVFFGLGGTLIVAYIFYRLSKSDRMDFDDMCEAGEYLWWDRRHRSYAVGTTGFAGLSSHTG